MASFREARVAVLSSLFSSPLSAVCVCVLSRERGTCVRDSDYTRRRAHDRADGGRGEENPSRKKARFTFRACPVKSRTRRCDESTERVPRPRHRDRGARERCRVPRARWQK